MGGGRESGQSYCVTYDVLRTAIHLLLKLPEWLMAGCVTYRTILQICEQTCMKRFMSSDLALRKGLLGQGLTADGGKGISELSDILSCVTSEVSCVTSEVEQSDSA